MTVAAKNIATPDEVRPFPNDSGHTAIVKIAGMAVSSDEFRPGWRWSNDIRPLVGTTRCELLHTGFALEGILHVEPADGEAYDLTPGDAFVIRPGHDAWVIGEQSFRMISWSYDEDASAKGLAP